MTVLANFRVGLFAVSPIPIGGCRCYQPAGWQVPKADLDCRRSSEVLRQVNLEHPDHIISVLHLSNPGFLYTLDAAADLPFLVFGGRRFFKKKTNNENCLLSLVHSQIYSHPTPLLHTLNKSECHSMNY